MGLYLLDAPKKALELVRDAIADLVNHPNVAASGIATSNPQDLTTAAEHPVYVIGLADLLKESLLKEAKVAGWRYLILNNDSALGSAEVTVTDDDEGLRFSHINRGPLVHNTIVGVSVAEELDAVKNNDYELRLLEIPSLYVTALWLHGHDDLIIPLPPTRSELTGYSVYTVEDLVKLLQKAATTRIEYDNR